MGLTIIGWEGKWCFPLLLSNAGGKMVQWGKMLATKPIARTHMVERDSLTKYPLTVTCTHTVNRCSI